MLDCIYISIARRDPPNNQSTSSKGIHSHCRKGNERNGTERNRHKQERKQRNGMGEAMTHTHIGVYSYCN